MKIFLIVVCVAAALATFALEPIIVTGRTMGTTYSITYFDIGKRNFSYAIDSLLKTVNSAINNYDPNSDVSIVNARGFAFTTRSIHFQHLLQQSLQFAQESEGYFDPTVMPLVNLWGFGPKKGMVPSPERIDSILTFVGHKNIRLEGNQVLKNHAQNQLDFGGIGQGYGVDVICDYLKAKGITDFLVELGGEGYAAGRNLKTMAAWRIGIIDPMSPQDEQRLLGYASVENEAFSTSGNYFNYRIIDEKKYGHTISPFTGWPVEHELISVSLFANNCTTADAWDTAFLAAGKNKSIDFLKKHKALSAVLIYVQNGKPAIFVSKNIENRIFLDSPYDN